MRLELHRIGFVGAAALVMCCVTLGISLGWTVAGQLGLQSLLLWAFVWQQTLQREHLNRFSCDTPLYSNLGLANRLTLSRGWLIAATGGFLLVPATPQWLPWIPAALYSVAAILDRVDGFVARRTSRTSLLGQELDTVFDALGLMVAPLLAVFLGKVHWSYLLVSVAYYCFVWGLHWRRTHNLAVYPLAPSKLRRALAGFQMGYVAVVLWPPFDAAVTVVAGFGFMVPLLVGFIVDWLVVSGRIQAQRPTTSAFFSRLAAFSERVVQPLLRLTMAITLVVVVQNTDSPLTIPLLITAALVLFGFGGRMAALAALMLLAWQFPGASIGLTGYLTLYSAIAILLLGCGRFSLWQWDDLWVNRQDGA